MIPIEKLRSLVGGDDKTYSYECTSCDMQFESPNANSNYLDCPDCGSDEVYSIV